MRHTDKECRVGFYKMGDVVFNFEMEVSTNDQEKKIAKAIFTLQDSMETVACALWSQFKDELGLIVRVDKVKEVFIAISDVYYPERYSEKKDINMTFYTEFIAEKIKREQGQNDLELGFVCTNTIGRFSRKDGKFHQISNGMLSRHEFM